MAHRPPLPYHAPALSAPAQAMPAYPSPSSSNKPGQFGTRTNPKSRTAASDLLCRPVNDGSTVSVSGLPSSQSETHLRGLLSRFGAVLYLEIHPDSHNPGKCKGTARARYQTSSEALNAVRGLDGATLANRKICVKQVKDDAVALASSGATRYESKRPVAATQVKKLSASMPAQPPRKHKPTRSPHHTRSKAQSSSAPPLVPSAEPASRNRGSTGSGSTSSAGPLVVNGATYSRRPSRDESSASDDSGEEDMDERDDKSSEEDDDENEGHAPGEFVPTPSNLPLLQDYFAATEADNCCVLA
ncbi:hypothetical protein A1O3_09241 [Capronia epimyces CBS 606.96]|uniref:RRM domain-containing protein n=1 Tax=Capronia epimyces CBS 606.96 TaxID=1182542 RepID=W9XL79_9EURO|nr:uncharacterized protein A1O3_09241 [Capronia epimyces CBS 606.96]EXJ78080.1 hypothetical protein A1O3_09241 [Capronia epimyces CBS 606.96]